MKSIMSIITLFTVCLAYGQTAIKKSNISSAGRSYTSGNTRVIFTVGEFAVQEQTRGNIHVSEGFIGPDNLAVGLEEYEKLQGVTLFPNPVTELLYLSFEQEGNYQIYLTDINGKQVLPREAIHTQNHTLDLSDMAAAVYFLTVINDDTKEYKSFKILKLK